MATRTPRSMMYDSQVYFMIFTRSPEQPAGYPWDVADSGWIPATPCTPTCDYQAVSGRAALLAMQYGESYSRTWDDEARRWNGWEHYGRNGAPLPLPAGDAFVDTPQMDETPPVDALRWLRRLLMPPL